MLSTLKNAKEGDITFYTGVKVEDLSHLKNCTLICLPNQNFKLKGVKIIESEDPQLYFYKLSEKYKKNYLDEKNLIFNDKYKSYIDKNSEIDESTTIFPGCIIGNVKIGKNCIIHPNVVIYSETIIGDNVVIEANTVIGAEGVMWVWEENKKIKLHQLGGTQIGNNVFIGSNVTIVRGSANEITKIGNNTDIAHGTKIGHGCIIKNNNHFANNVSLAGSVETFEDCFFGSGSVISSRIKIGQTIILGANSLLNSNVDKSGVYVGSPAKFIKIIKGNLHGVPKYKN